MKRVQGFAVINDTIGKKIAYTYSEIDEVGNIIKSNVKESYVAVDENVLAAITTIEANINTRLTETIV